MKIRSAVLATLVAGCLALSQGAMAKDGSSGGGAGGGGGGGWKTLAAHDGSSGGGGGGGGGGGWIAVFSIFGIFRGV